MIYEKYNSNLISYSMFVVTRRCTGQNRESLTAHWLVRFAVVAVVVGCYVLKALSLKVGDLRCMVVICGVQMVCIPSVLL